MPSVPSLCKKPWILFKERKYKRLKLDGGQAYDRSSDYTAVVAGATNNGP
jgi:hypothetical protein